MDGRNVAVFVLMRFNVRFPRFEHLDNNDPAWLDYRIRLAELTSFHSLKQQSLGKFKLVILIDSLTPERQVDALAGATEGLDVLLLRSESALPAQLGATLLDHAPAGTTAIQTSRIDSDDMFHPDYLRGIPDLAREPRYLRYAYGQDYLAESGTCNRILHEENAFGTLIEPATGAIETVFCDQHTRMSKRFVSFIPDEERSMWCRVLHGSNLMSKPRRALAPTGLFPVHPDLAEFTRLASIPPPPKPAPAPMP